MTKASDNLVERLRALDEVLAPDNWSGPDDFKRELAKLKARGAVREAATRIEKLQAALLDLKGELLAMGFEMPAGYVSKLFGDTPQRVLAKIDAALTQSEGA
jgi:hypothetical protein